MLLQIIIQIGGMSGELLNVLRGCLDPSSVHACENRLKQMSQHNEFTQQLLLLIPNQENQLLIMVLTTLKNYLLARYNSQQNRISNEQKQILRGNILELYYEIKSNSNAVKLYKEILYIIIAVDYPWSGAQNYLMQDLNNNIQAGVYFCRQMAKVCQYFQNNQREKLQIFINNVFPKLEQIVEQVLSNFNQATSKLLAQIFKTFYSSFHICIPHYLRNFQNIQRWLLFFNTIFNVPTDGLSAQSQEIAARCYLRFFSVYCNQAMNDQAHVGWAAKFRQYFGPPLFQFIYQLVSNRKGNEDILSTLINCIHQVAKKQELRFLLKQQQIRNLLYNGTLFHLCESTRDELDLFSNDEIEYVRRQDDLSCYPVRRAVQQLVEMAVNYLSFNQKLELFRMVQYSASVLNSSTSSNGQKEVVVRVLTKIGKIILRNKYLKSQFESLTIQYFLPLLRSNNKLLNSLVCELLSKYLPFGDLSPQTVTSLMELIYQKIVGETSLVVRYNAILAFTALLGHNSALQAAKPHFQAILQIYVKTLNAFDHQNLIQSLSSIVKHFDKQIVNFAPDLLPHLLRMFCSLAKNQKDTEEDEPDTNTPAKAALSTVKQILNCPLAPETYVNISVDLTQLLRGIFNQYNEYFDEVLSLYAVLVYKAKSIVDFEYPYAACRKLLEGNNQILQRSNVNGQLLGQLLKLEVADSEFQQSLVAILKNIIQKAPDQVIRNYPWPKHPELILALIQNQRISPQQLSALNTSQVDAIWTPYLAAYSKLIYGIGDYGNINQVHSILGVSLFPWLKQGVNPHLVKLIVDSIDDEEDQQDLIQQNTAQLLEKYANQDDDDQQASYFQSSGKNFGLLYDSPFDSAKDRDMLVAQVRNLNQQSAIALVNILSSKYKKKLQVLMNQPQ